MKKGIRRRLISTTLFGLSLGLALLFLVQLRYLARAQSLSDSRESFQVITELLADGIAHGYFEWSEFQLTVTQDQAVDIARVLGEIPDQFRFVTSATLADRRPPARAYQVVGQGNRLRLEFPLTNSQGKAPLDNKIAVVELDAPAMLLKVQKTPWFVLDSGGVPFAYGLTVRITEPPLTVIDLLVGLGLASIVGAISLLSFRREDRFFYEAKGLNTMIFLFEHAEHYSANHSQQVAHLTEALGKRLGFRGKKLKDLRTAALLHDIGKIAVSREILTKPSALTPEETQVIRAHAENSSRILQYFDELAHLAPVVRFHHEKMDGSGYPLGLQGDSIPLESRIIAVADIFEALTGERPYRQPFTEDRALAELRAQPLDQNIVEALADHITSLGGRPVFLGRNLPPSREK